MLQEVRDKKAVVVMIIDLLDASGSLMAKVRGGRGRLLSVIILNTDPDSFECIRSATWLARIP